MKKYFLMNFILVSFLCAPYVQGSFVLAEEAKKHANLNIETKTIHQQNQFVTIDIRIPIIHGLTDKEFQEELNTKMKDGAMKARHMILLSLQEELKQAKEKKRPFIPLELTIQYEVTNKKDILSFYITTYEFTGGAHGITETDYYNISTKENKCLSLADLFKPDSNYKATINSEIKKQIKQQEAAGEGSYFHENDPYISDAGFQTISDDQNFYIQEGNLVVAFGQYEIAPGYMGEPTFEIPLASLQGILKEEFNKLIP